MRIFARTLIALVPLAIAAPASAQWKETAVPELGYSAAFPVKPKPGASVSNGVKLNSYSAAATGVFCNVLVQQYPQPLEPNAELTASMNSFQKGIDGEISSTERTTVARGAQQLPAMEVKASNDVFNFRALFVVDGARVYQVAGGVPKYGGREGDLEKCVRGLELTAS